MARLILCFLRDERGTTPIEYGVIALFTSVAIIGAATTLGGNVITTWSRVSGNVQ